MARQRMSVGAAGRGIWRTSSKENETLDDYKHPDWSQSVTDNAYFHALVTSVSASHMTVKIGKLNATLSPADWVWTGVAKATDLAQVGDIVYVKVVSGADTATPHVILEQDSGAQAALMAVNNADGEVLAMVGGRDFQLSPVQPRHSGRAPGRVLLQALRVHGGDGSGHEAV